MIGEAAWLFVELLALFIGVSFLLNMSQRRLGNTRLKTLMGATPMVAALRGIAVGFITPFCTYSTIPVLVAFRQAGVTAAGYVAFVMAAPVLDPILFGALMIIVGWKAALLYLGVTFAAALGLALVAEKIGLERFMKPLPTLAGGAEAADAGHWQGWRAEWRPAWRASRKLLLTMAPLLVVGVGIGLAITALLPAETVTRVPVLAGDAAIPAAAAVGTLFYVNTEVFIPIADALRSAGIGIGAIVALTISGAGFNIPEFVILAKLAGKGVLVAFGVYVFAVAAVGGLLAQLLVG